MLRLFPRHEPEVDPQAAYSGLGLPALAPPGRPYVIVNMVSTVDGQAKIGENTDELGNAADATLFARLREEVDCVMAGTRTVEIEGYNAPARKPETRERRRRNGLAERPVFATATRSGVLPVSAPLFQDPELEVVVFSEGELVLGDAAAKVTQVATSDPRQMLAELHGEHGVRALLLEGGPSINAPFFEAELVDELFLTVAPVLTGSAVPFPIIRGRLPQRQTLHLLGALLDEDHLFLRYRVG